MPGLPNGCMSPSTKRREKKHDFDRDFFFYPYTTAFASSFLCPGYKEAKRLAAHPRMLGPALRGAGRPFFGIQRMVREDHFPAAGGHDRKAIRAH